MLRRSTFFRTKRICSFPKAQHKHFTSFATPFNLSKSVEKVEETTTDIERRYAQSVLPVYNRPPLVLARGQGSYVFDENETCYLDFTSGIAVNALGHSHPLILAAINQQAEKLIHVSNLFHTLPPIKLAEKILVALQNNIDSDYWEDGKVFFSNSGTESIEAAFKFARKYGNSEGKYKIISVTNGFHGRTFGALSATPNEKYQKPFMPLVPGFKTAQMNDLASVANKMDVETCAVIVEPIQGEGGIVPANVEFVKGLRKLCDEYNALLIFDEIQCGLGRTGDMWAHKALEVCPDMITLAKPLANGLPIGATILTEKVAQHLKPGDHGSTFGGNPLVCAVATAVLQVIDQPYFLRRVKNVGNLLMGKLKNLQSQFPELIEEVRGRGLMVGIQMKKEGINDALVQECREKNLLILTAGNNTVRLLPPLIVDTEDVEKAVDIIGASMCNIATKK
jgi:predicted acetylornithine/succinylornithine family transaminase